MTPLDWPDDDSDMPLEQDLVDDDDSLPDMICPSCRGWVTEDTQKCPHCGDWITAVKNQKTGAIHTRQWLLVIAVVLMLVAMICFVL